MTKFNISYERNGECQTHGMNAESEEIAPTYLRERKPDATFYGINEATRSDERPGKPVIDVPADYVIEAATEENKEAEEEKEGKNTMTKFEALVKFLIEEGEATAGELAGCTEENTYNEAFNTFEIIGNEYKVLTEEEAEEAAKENIINDLWAFNADFILRHTVFYENSTDTEDKEFVKAVQSLQGSICEGATPIIKALIKDIDDFVENAIDADGRGHFISWYDGEEYEAGDYYIYRTN